MPALERSEEEITLKNEIITIYEDIFITIWDKLCPTLGIITIVPIFHRAILRTTEQFVNLEFLKVTEEGIDFGEFKLRSAEDDKEIIKSSLNELIGNLFDILVKLTGNILVNRLMKVIVVSRLNRKTKSVNEVNAKTKSCVPFGSLVRIM